MFKIRDEHFARHVNPEEIKNLRAQMRNNLFTVPEEGQIQDKPEFIEMPRDSSPPVLAH